MIYRENGRRYIPIKFSVRGRDLAGTIQDAQSRLAQKIRLPEGYHMEWAGEYDSLQKEKRRLAVIIPISLAIILALLFTAFNSLRRAFLVLAILPFGLIGGVLSLLITHTPFSISAAVGFASVIGVCTLGGGYLCPASIGERRMRPRFLRRLSAADSRRCGRLSWPAPPPV